MAEYGRTMDGAGNLFQWVDTELYMVLDRVTGEPCAFGRGNDKMGTFEDAIMDVQNRPGWESRMVVVKLACVSGFRVSAY